MLSNQQFQVAAGHVLEYGLGLSSDESIVIMFDETASKYIDSFIHSCQERNIKYTILFTPLVYQKGVSKRIYQNRDKDQLPLPMVEALSSADAILTLVDGSTSSGAFRKAVITAFRDKNARLVHIPGVDDHVLSCIERSDFPKIEREGELLAWCLGTAQHARIKTQDANGNTYCLDLNLGGWENEPLISTGRQLKGGWGNLPPGEVFCCPKLQSVDGKIVVNGSVPDHAFNNPSDGFLLEFREGQITSWEPLGPIACQIDFFERLQNDAQDRGDPNWNRFAELGIGLNSAIDRASGNSLFDEKMAGTIHIAIGDNTVFGGPVASDIHVDMVVLAPTVELDRRIAIDEGVLQVDAISAFRAGWAPEEAMIDPAAEIVVLEGNVHQDAATGVLRRRISRAGRVGFVDMAERDESVALASLVRNLRGANGFSIGQIIEDHPKIRDYETERLLDKLIHYRCVSARNPGQG